MGLVDEGRLTFPIPLRGSHNAHSSGKAVTIGARDFESRGFTDAYQADYSSVQRVVTGHWVTGNQTMPIQCAGVPAPPLGMVALELLSCMPMSLGVPRQGRHRSHIAWASLQELNGRFGRRLGMGDSSRSPGRRMRFVENCKGPWRCCWERRSL